MKTLYFLVSFVVSLNLPFKKVYLKRRKKRKDKMLMGVGVQ